MLKKVTMLTSAVSGGTLGNEDWSGTSNLHQNRSPFRVLKVVVDTTAVTAVTAPKLTLEEAVSDEPTILDAVAAASGNSQTVYPLVAGQNSAFTPPVCESLDLEVSAMKKGDTVSATLYIDVF